MINYEKIGEKLFSIVKGHGHNLNMFNEEGMETTDASEARRFFVNKPNYMITLDEENRKIKFNKNSNLELSEIEGVMKQIKNLAIENMLKSEIKVFGKEITPKDFAYQASNYKDRNMDIQEASLSRMSGSTKTSYQTLESVKMIVRHRKPVSEEVRGARSRQISAIFLEQAGERFRFPHNHLSGARAMARHMYEGGNMRDTLGEYIIESVANVIKLSEFVRYARSNKLINETSEDIVKTVKENIATIRGELKGLTGAKSYSTVSEAIASREATVIEENDTTELQDIFTVHKFDEKIADILPLVKRLMDNKQTWRDALVEASEKAIAITEKTPISEDDVLEFDSPTQQMGYKVKAISERMIEESDLSNFVSKVAGKLIEGEDISTFEQKVVSNVLGNAIITEENEKMCDDCGEVMEDCGCTPKDVIDIIVDSYELKMKMIESEWDEFEAANKKVNEEDESCLYCGKAHHADDCKEYDGLDENEGETCQTCNGSGEGEFVERGVTTYCPDCKWMDPAGGLHDKNEDDPAAMYEEGEYADCERCKGTGLGGGDPDDPLSRCLACNGTGSADPREHRKGPAWRRDSMHEDELEPDYADCERCNGTGIDNDDPMGLCALCDGSGHTDYVKGSRQDPFSGNYGVDVEDFIDGDEADTIF